MPFLNHKLRKNIIGLSKKILKPWKGVKGFKCVILCGGKGTRLLPLSLKRQKGMIEVKGKPILAHIIDYWRQFADEFVFVVKYKKGDIYRFVKGLPINAEFVEPKKLKGIANGIYQTKGLVGDKFIVVLGDCVCKGRFKFRKDYGAWCWGVGDKE